LKIHIVKKGDSLHEIAKKYKVELDQLIALNREIGDPNKIEVGMKVKIPVSPKPVEPHVSDYAHKHIVNQGDSLWKLCKAWEIPLLDMIKANPQLKNPNVLMTGEVVYIPKLHHDVHHDAQNVAYTENDAYTPHSAHESMLLPDQFSYPPMGSMPSMPSIPPMGSVPSMPSVPPMGSVPSMPTVPPMGSVPSMPSVPPMESVPSMPSVPQMGSEPSMPSMPQMGSVPSMPSMPFMPSEPNMPYSHGQMGDISSTPAHMSPAYNAPWLQTGFPTTGYDASGLNAGYSPEGLKPEGFSKDSMMPGLHEPYPQAVHPFQQFSISATEAFAYPSQPGYPTAGMHQLPWGGMETSVYPQHDYSVGSYSVPGYSDGGCGCGSESSISSGTEGWNPNPAYTSSFMQYPQTPMPIYPHSTMYPNPSYPIGGELSQSYMPHMQMAPTSFPYPASYEAPKLPQEAYTHQWNETTELTESTEDREVKNDTTSKSKSGAKKNKSSASASLSAYLKRQQREARPEPRPNLPWINS
jgi:morphogenetic protein associated with SpoVID